MTIAFGGGAQDTASPNMFASHVFGHFVILGGTGDYAELYGIGRLIGAASDSSTCASGFGVNISLVGEVHDNWECPYQHRAGQNPAARAAGFLLLEAHSVGSSLTVGGSHQEK